MDSKSPLLRRIALGLALFAALLGLALATTRATYSRTDLVLVAVMYLWIAFWLDGLNRLALRLRGALGLLVQLGSGFLSAFVLGFQLREQTRWPESLGTLLVVVALLTLVVFALYLWVHGRASSAAEDKARKIRREAGALVVSGLLLLAWTVTLALQVPTFRWHLVRHNTMVGTPLYYLALPNAATVAPPVSEAPVEPSSFADPRDPARFTAGEERGPDSAPPSVIVLLIDTLRADALSAWGGSGAMPYLDSIVARSFRFEDVLANSSWTRPSVASLFTGLTPEEHGARNINDRLPEAVVTLADRLQGRVPSGCVPDQLRRGGQRRGIGSGIRRVF